MIDESVVRQLVEQVLSAICVAPEYDRIEVLPIVDVDGRSLKFWVKRLDQMIAEGQCYPHLYNEDDVDPVIRIYWITCPRQEPVAETYEAWFDNLRLSKKFHGEKVVPLSQ